MTIATASNSPFVVRLTLLFVLASFMFPSVATGQDAEFTVTVGNKTANHPNNPGSGFPEAFYIDGEEAAVLTLERGTTYTFQMQNVPSTHPFYISTSQVGAGAGEYTDGVTGSMAIGNATLTFTPSESTPDDLFYQCGVHQFMGWQINVVDGAQSERFVADLSGAQSVPANASRGSGSVSADLDGNTLTVVGDFAGLESDFNADIAGGAHLHLGLAGQNGGVDIPLNATLDENNRSGTFEAADNTFELDEEQISALRGRRYYVNIHTQEIPSGELRGQLLADGATIHHAVLSGRAAAPANTSRGIGGVLLELVDDELVTTGYFRDLASDYNADIAGGAHLHLAPLGENGGVEVPLNVTLGEDGRSGSFEAVDNTVSLSSDQRQAFLDGDLYVNIHSDDIPAGELRGQVLPLSHRVFEASLSGRNASPPAESPAEGGALAIYNEDSGELILTGNFSGLASDFNADIAGGSHLHLAPVGANGGVDIPLNAALDEDNRSGSFLQADNTFMLEEDQIEALFDGRFYVNVHTQDIPRGELRGQVLPSTNAAPQPAGLDDAIVVLGDDDVIIEWSGDSDTNNNRLAYLWELAMDEEFGSPFFTAVAAERMVMLSADSLRSILRSAGFRAGQADTVYQRVAASDGSIEALSDVSVLGFEMGVPTFQRAVEFSTVAENLTSPVTLTEPDDGTGRLFIVDQVGQIRIVHPDGALQDEPFLDISDRMVELRENFDERGLLGLAFHPNYETNGRFFVYYSAPARDGAPEGWDHTSHISEFSVSDSDADMADPESERILLQVDQPQFNHDGGTVAFSPEDGFLYVSLGDGGGSNDNQMGHVEDWYDFNDGGNAQNVEESLLGSILRLDVDNGDPYRIPSDNPFVGRDGLDEIYAYGFRNPYRFSFDMGDDHILLAGDAGQGRWEEVSRVERGGNYGWNVYEGTHCFDASDSSVDAPDCPTTVGEGHPDEGESLLMPVIEYANLNQGSGLGVAVVGGYVYRGNDLGDLDGHYVFGDWSTSFQQADGQLLIASPQQDGLWNVQRLRNDSSPDGGVGHFLLGFGQDRSGEIYVLTTDQAGPTGMTGMVHRLEDSGDVPAEELPEIVQTLTLDPAYPNPFSNEMTVRVHLPSAGGVTAVVYDLLGRRIRTLRDAHEQPGTFSLMWDGADAAGHPAPNGMYLVQVRSGQSAETLAVTLLR